MHPRLGDTHASPTSFATKRKKPPAPPERGDEWLKCRGYDLSHGPWIERSTESRDRDVIGPIEASKVRQEALWKKV
jgi:hypothetical protein